MTAEPLGFVEVAAPAKLNLALHVGPRRADGFHEIASLMVPVTLADHLRAERLAGGGLEVRCEVAPGELNLAAKAIRLLEERLERIFDVRLTITKRTPHAAGLGGGSSDAAAALLAVDRLFGLELEPRVLYEVASAVGSDVAFFLWPGPQFATGRGQVLKEVALPALHLVIVAPSLPLSARCVYEWRDEDAEVALRDWVPVVRGLSGRVAAAQSAADVAALVHNDLEGSVIARHPEVGELRDRLLAAGALAAAMSGSGAAVFGVFDDEETAVRARAGLTSARSWYVTDVQPEPPAFG